MPSARDYPAHTKYDHEMAQSEAEIVFILDDDPGIREAMSLLLASFDMQVVTFGSAAEYLMYPMPDIPACLVLDVQLPDINGMDLQARLALGNYPHVVFVTGHGDIPSTVRAMKSGAVDVLTKPFSEADLMAAINAALELNRGARNKQAEASALTRRFSSLTPREQDVLPLIVSGLLNKQAAAELGISETTLQIHRSRIMKKIRR
jgi:FixJ family two-component response regulator